MLKNNAQKLKLSEYHSLDCVVCGNKKFQFIFSDFDKYIESSKEVFSFFKCMKCELITIHPKISKEDLNIYYPKNYIPFNLENKKKTILNTIVKNFRDLIINFLQIDKSKLELNKFKYLQIKYLDFGCGNCRNLFHIRDQYSKWELFGYDKSEFSKNMIIRNNFNLIDNLENIEDNFFDVINLSSVIEHLEFPDKDIKLLKNKLKKNGIIIIKTPNWKSLGRIIFKKNWINYDLPRHMHIFSVKNLKKFLTNNGFEILRLQYSYNIGVELKSIYRVLKIKKKPKLHNLFTKIFLPLGVFINLICLSSTITIFGKKID